jgi:hypothetical protein
MTSNSMALFGLIRARNCSATPHSLHPQTGTVGSGLIHVPHEAHWLDVHILKLTTFPKGKHDDQVDSPAQAIECFKKGTFEPGLLAYYRSLVEGSRGNAAGCVRLKVPPGITHVCPAVGPSIEVGRDCTIKVDAETAIALMAAGYRRIA